MEILDKDQSERKTSQGVKVQPLWSNIGRIIAIIQMLFGAFLLSYLLVLLYDVAQITAEHSDLNVLSVFGSFLGRANATIIVTLAISTSGFLLWHRKNVGWIGTFLTMGISGILFVIIYYFDRNLDRTYRINENGQVEFSGRNEFYLLASLISVLLFIILISRNFRQVYKTKPLDWAWIVGVVGFVIVDWVILFWWR